MVYGQALGQEIADNSGWIGGYEEPTKKWTPPKDTKKHSDGEAWKETEEWLGGGSSSSLGYSPKRAAKQQIKIEGMTSSIKNNPFLKNNN